MEKKKFLLMIILTIIVLIVMSFVVFQYRTEDGKTAMQCSPYSKGFCNKVLEFCDSIHLSENECYSTIVSSVTSQGMVGAETCESLEPFYRNKCYAVIAKESVLSMPAKAETLCDKITEDARNAWCLQGLAVYLYAPMNSKAVDICNKIFVESLKDECFFMVAKRAADFSLPKAKEICKEISFESQKTVCNANVTASYDQEEAAALCNELEDSQEKEGCLAQIES